MEDNTTVESLLPVVFGDGSDEWTPQVILSIIEEAKRLEREKLTAEIVETIIRDVRESVEPRIGDNPTQAIYNQIEGYETALKRFFPNITEIDSIYDPKTGKLLCSFYIKLS
jgi:hypothetical protein